MWISLDPGRNSTGSPGLSCDQHQSFMTSVLAMIGPEIISRHTHTHACKHARTHAHMHAWLTVSLHAIKSTIIKIIQIR